ncbi:MAG: chorismate lyase / 3-hydroxybenzoate synthase [Pseudomonadota bacterium]|nr:chorismate lyase / 3-hydroxybenzoate synthase [Pseudomonadota bacterium]
MLGLAFLPATGLSGLSRQDNLLGGACFSHPARMVEEAGIPLLAVDMALPLGEAAACEVWHCREPLQSGQHGAIRYRQGDTLLFGCLSLDEAAGDTRPPLQTTTEAAYQSIFQLLEARGFGSVLRFWNYFPAINQESRGIERYRQFNAGRQDAFLAHGRSVIGNVPAACALGSASGGLHIAFLATRAAVIGIENPRQLSAYHYPSQYGPRSPTFSRAGLVRLGGRDMLFISGTASIVGHQTLHAGDVAAQTRESLHNIAAIVAEANRLAPEADFRLDQLAYKVYVRRPADLEAVRLAMAEFIDVPAPAIFLQADVCRAELLVEIEASGGHSIRAGAGE